MKGPRLAIERALPTTTMTDEDAYELTTGKPNHRVGPVVCHVVYSIALVTFHLDLLMYQSTAMRFLTHSGHHGGSTAVNLNRYGWTLSLSV